MTSRKPTEVWKYFSQDDTTFATCLGCADKVKRGKEDIRASCSASPLNGITMNGRHECRNRQTTESILRYPSERTTEMLLLQKLTYIWTKKISTRIVPNEIHLVHGQWDPHCTRSKSILNIQILDTGRHFWPTWDFFQKSRNYSWHYFVCFNLYNFLYYTGFLTFLTVDRAKD